MENIEKVCNFLKESKPYYLATAEKDQPRVRPFGSAVIYNGRLYIHMGKGKRVSNQLAQNPKAEICAFNKGKWMRIQCELVEDPSFEAQKAVLDGAPYLRNSYSENDGKNQVWYMKNAVAYLDSFTDELEVIEF